MKPFSRTVLLVMASDLLSRKLSKKFSEYRWYHIPASMLLMTIIFGSMALYWPEDVLETFAMWLLFMFLFVVGFFKRRKHERIQRELKASAEADAAYSDND